METRPTGGLLGIAGAAVLGATIACVFWKTFALVGGGVLLLAALSTAVRLVVHARRPGDTRKGTQ